MSCIIGKVDENGRVYMIADSCGISENFVISCSTKKIVEKKDMLIGVTGSFRVLQLIRYNFTLPKHKKNLTSIEYLNKCFVPKFREVLAENGCLSEDRGIESFEATLLIGYRGELFIIESDFQVRKSIYNYEAIGAGRDVAYPLLFFVDLLYNNKNLKQLSTRESLIFIMKSISKFFTSIEEPFIIGYLK